MLTQGALINIDVPDINKAEAFYCGVFDLKVTRRIGPGAVELSGFVVPCYLLEKAGGTKAFRGDSRSREYSRHWTPVHLDISVTDIRAVYDRAVAAGAVPEAEIREAPYGKIVLMSDPFGHGFCLIEFNERGYDAL
jgi:predicted enzyme related to lactoylglutathione lyase